MRAITILTMLVLLSACGGSSTSEETTPIESPKTSWEGYANQREDFFDTYHAVKSCLINSGLKLEQDRYPYVYVTDNLIENDGKTYNGYAIWEPGNHLYVCKKILSSWIYSHELIHLFMHWTDSDHNQPAFETCGKIILICTQSTVE